MPCPRSLHGGSSDIAADDARAGLREHRREVSVAAPEIERALAGRDRRDQKPPPALELRGRQLVGQLLPELLVVVLHRATVPPHVLASPTSRVAARL
jgi:hypothetical protein